MHGGIRGINSIETETEKGKHNKGYKSKVEKINLIFNIEYAKWLELVPIDPVVWSCEYTEEI
jgi:hypothetical protein